MVSLNEATRSMNSKLLLKSHLSFYAEEDMDVIDSYRTKPICGMLCGSPVNSVPAKSLIEIDVSKAYTSAFKEITIKKNKSSMSSMRSDHPKAMRFCHSTFTSSKVLPIRWQLKIARWFTANTLETV